MCVGGQRVWVWVGGGTGSNPGERRQQRGGAAPASRGGSTGSSTHPGAARRQDRLRWAAGQIGSPAGRGWGRGRGLEVPRWVGGRNLSGEGGGGIVRQLPCACQGNRSRAAHSCHTSVPSHRWLRARRHAWERSRPQPQQWGPWLLLLCWPPRQPDPTTHRQPLPRRRRLLAVQQRSIQGVQAQRQRGGRGGQPGKRRRLGLLSFFLGLGLDPPACAALLCRRSSLWTGACFLWGCPRRGRRLRELRQSHGIGHLVTCGGAGGAAAVSEAGRASSRPYRPGLPPETVAARHDTAAVRAHPCWPIGPLLLAAQPSTAQQVTEEEATARPGLRRAPAGSQAPRTSGGCRMNSG